MTVLDGGAPLYGRATQAFAVRPLRAGYLGDVFPSASPTDLIRAYAVWGGMPRYWELAAPFGNDLAASVDALVLDPAAPLHNEPDRLLRAEVPPATALRPLLDVIGNGAHRVSEVAGRLGRQASSLSGPLASLVDMGLVRREIPFGSNQRSGKRSLYRIADPFLRLWFRVVAPNRAALAEAPQETRLTYWRKHRAALEGEAWEELCRMATATPHRVNTPLRSCGPFEPAQRYWKGGEPELDVVARSVDERSLLVGEAKWSASRDVGSIKADHVPGVTGSEVVPTRFLPGGLPTGARDSKVIDARMVLEALR